MSVAGQSLAPGAVALGLVLAALSGGREGAGLPLALLEGPELDRALRLSVGVYELVKAEQSARAVNGV